LKTKKKNDNKLKPNSDPVECREFQLSGLLSWKNPESEGEPEKSESVYYEMNSVLGANLETYTDNLQAILVNPPWSSTFGFNEFTKIKLPLNKMKEGLIFVWTDKEHISDIVYYFEKQDIKYVENLVWIMLNPDNKGNQILNNVLLYIEQRSSTSDPFNLCNVFKKDEYKHFTKSHLTLLIFRKVIFLLLIN
jgi:hypothetical protein